MYSAQDLKVTPFSHSQFLIEYVIVSESDSWSDLEM